MPIAADLDIKIGDSFWSDRWGVLVDDAPVDLTTGWVVRAQIRPRPDSTTVLHDFTGDGILLTPPAPGEEPDTTIPSTVQLYIPQDEAALLGAWTAVWDLQIEHPTYGLGGTFFRRTVLAGVARTAWDVTRDV